MTTQIQHTTTNDVRSRAPNMNLKDIAATGPMSRLHSWQHEQREMKTFLLAEYKTLSTTLTEIAVALKEMGVTPPSIYTVDVSNRTVTRTRGRGVVKASSRANAGNLDKLSGAESRVFTFIKAHANSGSKAIVRGARVSSATYGYGILRKLETKGFITKAGNPGSYTYSAV